VKALISAELLRLRTVRSTVPSVLGALLFITATTIGNTASRPSDFKLALGGAPLLVAILIAGGVATIIGYDYKRGAVGLTYLAEPRRERVFAARVLTYAGLGAGFAAVAISLASLGAGVWAARHGSHIGLAASDVTRFVAQAAAAGAAAGALGVLAGTAVRNPTAASQVLVLDFVIEELLPSDGIARFGPFSLVQATFGTAPHLDALPALALLFGALVLGSLAVIRWAVPRDLT
jgi:hypothetical protein